MDSWCWPLLKVIALTLSAKTVEVILTFMAIFLENFDVFVRDGVEQKLNKQINQYISSDFNFLYLLQQQHYY